MFEHHFGLRENPFPAGHQLKFVYPSREHQEARAHLRYGIENREPFLLITGEVGTGKTTSLYDALNEWGDRVAVALITNSSLTRQELLEEICLRFGMQMQPGVSKPAALVMLEKHLVAVRARGEHAVLMMDEAQNLSMDLLEEIRLLSNLEHKGEKLLQIFLVGQPELEAHLARHELRQLRQRITVHYRLNPLSPDETLGYIHHHINIAGGNAVQVFPPESCREIYRLTHGIPREINTLASSSLIAAYADSSPCVTLQHITAAVSEGDFRSVLSNPSTRPESAPEASAPVSAPVQPPPARVTRVQPAAPAGAPSAPWPALPRPAAEAPRAAAAMPAPPEPDAESVPAPREPRGEISKGLVAAMRRSEVPPARPQLSLPPPIQRPAFASQPAQFHAPTLMPARGSDAGMPPADLSGLPPRLRARLERELSLEETGASPLRNWLIAVSVLATLMIMLILMQRFGAIDVPFLRGPAGSQATHSPASDMGGELLTPASEDPSAALIDSLRREVETARDKAAVHTASTPASVAQPARTPAAAVDTYIPSSETPVPPSLSAPDSGATGSATDSGMHYGVGVASFLDADRARGERLRLSRDTTLPGVVVPFRDSGTTMYRVVLGRWSTAADAETAANALMERGLINEARVVQIPRR
jgi:type II secretory pathway predicted ATPase ExeA